MNGEKLPRSRGRPRVYPAGTTQPDIVAAARARNRAAGGHALNVDLGPLAWQALQKLAPKGKRTQLIERLIIDAARRKPAG